jgi:RNA polymerase primary sigma factor
MRRYREATVKSRCSNVQVLVAVNPQRVVRNVRFSLRFESQEAEMLRRARRMARVGPERRAEIVRRIADRLGCAPGTVRAAIRRHDRGRPDDPIFPDRSAPLSERDREVIYHAALRGLDVARLSRRFGRSSSTIRRIIQEQRAREILAEKTDYVDNEFFHRPEAEAAILGQPLEELLPRHRDGRQPKIPQDLPPYLQGLYRLPLLTKDQEVALFRRYNYLKYRIAQLKQHASPRTLSAAHLAAIQDFKRQAHTVKNVLVQSNLRLVVSIAKRHVGRLMNFFELVSDGNISLMRAVERFDYAKGNKFSTYASWAIIKNFARSIPTEISQLDRYMTGRDEILDTSSDRRRPPAGDEPPGPSGTRELIGRFLRQLSQRECQVIVSRFGLADGVGPLKLEDVGREMGVTKERIRQIEARALDKLRGMMDPEVFQVVAV